MVDGRERTHDALLLALNRLSAQSRGFGINNGPGPMWLGLFIGLERSGLASLERGQVNLAVLSVRVAPR
jgi:hypothetical protein